MAQVHYRFEWVAREDQTEDYYKLFDDAQGFDCNLRLVADGVKTNRDGYYVESLVLDAPDQEAADQFLTSSSFSRIITEWQILSAETRNQLSTYFYNDPDFIGYSYGDFVQGVFEKTYLNKELQILLEKAHPVYFAYDWVVPSQLLANPLEAQRVSWIDWHYKFASSVMFDIVTSAWQLGKGREVRLGKEFAASNGLLGVSLILRLFNQSELARYLQSHRTKIFDERGWKPTLADDFLSAHPLVDQTLRTFYAVCAQKSEFNKTRMDHR